MTPTSGTTDQTLFVQKTSPAGSVVWTLTSRSDAFMDGGLYGTLQTEANVVPGGGEGEMIGQAIVVDSTSRSEPDLYVVGMVSKNATFAHMEMNVPPGFTREDMFVIKLSSTGTVRP